VASGEKDVGHAGSVYCASGQQLSLGPLPAREARGVLERCTQGMGLQKLDLEGFREEVLRLSGSVPGAIVRMCHLAQAAKYQVGSRPKTKLIRIDCLMSAPGFDHLAAARDHY
jgi:hypothetical protein